ncbi:hypothetical protein ACOMHN_046487 [Nucella lapillus]
MSYSRRRSSLGSAGGFTRHVTGNERNVRADCSNDGSYVTGHNGHHGSSGGDGSSPRHVCYRDQHGARCFHLVDAFEPSGNFVPTHFEGKDVKENNQSYSSIRVVASGSALVGRDDNIAVFSRAREAQDGMMAALRGR